MKRERWFVGVRPGEANLRRSQKWNWLIDLYDYSGWLVDEYDNRGDWVTTSQPMSRGAAMQLAKKRRERIRRERAKASK